MRLVNGGGNAPDIRRIGLLQGERFAIALQCSHVRPKNRHVSRHSVFCAERRRISSHQQSQAIGGDLGAGGEIKPHPVELPSVGWKIRVVQVYGGIRDVL